jgi:hypothetical protein
LGIASPLIDSGDFTFLGSCRRTDSLPSAGKTTLEIAPVLRAQSEPPVASADRWQYGLLPIRHPKRHKRGALL